MSQRKLGRKFEVNNHQLGPIVKINVRKYLNLPKIRKEEEEFQTLIDSFDSEQKYFYYLLSLSFNEQSSYLKCIQIRSKSNKSKNNKEESPQKAEEFQLYGFARIKSDRFFLYSRKNSIRNSNSMNKSKLDESVSFDWVEHCKTIGPPHAKAQFYSKVKNEYIWEEVEVIDFNDQTQKYIVKQYPNGLIKKVNKYQVQFYTISKLNQNVKPLSQKLITIQKPTLIPQKLIKNNQSLIQSERNLSSSHSSHRSETKDIFLPSVIRQRLFSKFIDSNKFKLLNNLLDEVNQQYTRDMKKCKNLLTMKQYKQIIKPFPRSQRFSNMKLMLQNQHIFSKSDTARTTQHFSERCDKFKIGLFGIQDVAYPINIYKWIDIINSNSGEFITDFRKHRHYIISEIQDNLKNDNFVESNKEKYQNSRLQKLVNRIQIQYSDFLFKVLYEQIVNLQQFYYSFELKQQSQIINSNTYIILDAKCNKYNQTNNNSNINIKSDEILISIIPTLQEVLELLMYPNTILKQQALKQNTIENSLLPLLLLKEHCIFNINHLPKILIVEKETEQFIEKEYQICDDIVKQYRQFEYFMIGMNSKQINNLFGIEGKKNLRPMLSYLNYKQIREHLLMIKKDEYRICRLTASKIKCGLFQLELKELQTFLIGKAQIYFNVLTQKIVELIKFNTSLLSTQYHDMFTKSSTIPSKEEELIELKLFLDELQMTFSKLNNEVMAIQQYFDLLEEVWYNYEVKLYEDYLQLLYWPFEITEAYQINKKAIQIQEKAFLLKLDKEKLEFQKTSTNIMDLFDEIRQFKHYDPQNDYLQQVNYLSDLIVEAKYTTNSFNQREIMFSLPNSQYSELELLYKEFKPYQNLWEIIAKFQIQRDQWLYGSFKKLNHQTMIFRIKQFLNESVTVSNYFKEIKEENALSLSRGFRNSVDEFKEKLWIVEALAIEAFQKKPSLWRDLFRDCKIQNFDPKEDFPLSALLQRGILNVKDDVLALSHRAEKGWNIEKRLNEMQEKLIAIELEVSAYSETFVFKNYDEVQALLDEQLNVLAMLKSQHHIRMVIGKANQLEYKIVLIEDTLEYAMKCQKHWMYLDPIFESEDIQKKLSKETAQFKEVDQSYRRCMSLFSQNKILWDCIDNEKLKIEFSSNVLMLDLIQKSLNIYLEQKRILFPRFYFLSDEELVEILAQTKDPSKLQKHIFKCFEGIHELEFIDNRIITGILSIQREKVSLNQCIDVTKGSRQGNVEQWLSDLQNLMQISVKTISQNTMKDLNCTKLEYITKWPGQSILLSNHIKWTRNTESAIRLQQKLTLKTYLELLNQELQETVYLVRNDERQIQRNTLEAMIVLEVHTKDIVSNLAKIDVQSIHDFNWISQLRYYNTGGDFKVKMVNAVVNYGFEYLGKINRLVITSLTDRCQRTLLGALHMHYGGAPEGPAGTGKSETVKDLAKAVGMPCIIFNCSDGLNYIAMGKFFKGLASSGAWCCFDEFNRIDPEVLSVVAQQIFTIQKAIKEERLRFVFEGEEIGLISTCAINVTMNPGYTGRSELPDNLKILFRPCAMMVPDYAMIAEIYLYSIGFEKARELSSKIVTCLRLCNEQLSQQEHYDFGMRALKAVLNTAKLFYEGTEEIICLTALMRVNKPKFTENDYSLFKAITEDLFPDLVTLGADELNMEDACQDLELQMDDTFLEKCEQLQNNVLVRNGVMCIGLTFSGKSTSVNALGKTLGVSIFKLNPKAVTTDQLYGRLDPDTKQWSEGVSSILIRENLKKQNQVWIVFDGPVDSLWIENLNTVLDDNKKLCLTSGEILKIPESMCMIFEVENLIAASPATVSRCGMVYYLPINWYILVQSIQLPQGFDQDYFIRRLRFLIDHSLAWIAEFAQMIMENFENIVVSGMLRLLNKLLSTLNSSEQPQEIWDNYIMFSLIWSLGAGIEEKYRNNFNDFLHRLLRTKKSGLKTKYPDDLEIQFPLNDELDFFQNVYLNYQWVKWSSLQQQIDVHKGLAFHEIIVPTAESSRNDYLSQIGLHYLFCGSTGTGKSMSMSKSQKFQINCSGQTTANAMQRLIETKINKRRRKGYYGSEEGHIRIFVDDLNLPKRESNGAQPAIELLRQWMDQGGWYDLETKEFKYMCDITFISAAQPPKGESTSITMRYMRFFNILYIGGLDNQSITSMLTIFVNWMYLRIGSNSEILEMKNMIINSTISLYERAQQILLPTPTKSHYIYSVRDLFRIIEGMSQSDKIINKYQLIRLWAHECQRTFQDRLVDEYDKKLFENLVKEQINQSGYHLHDFTTILYASFMTKKYEEITKFDDLKNKLQQIQEELNQLFQQNRSTIIFFQDAILHIARITRIISGVQSHALLIGMSGSGRQSLAKIANFIVFKQLPVIIDTRCWDEQLLTVLKEIGLENVKQTFLFNDTSFIQEYMLEDVCNIMSHGEVPHLFTPEERFKIQEELAFPRFIEHCKLNTHIILCMQPIGAQFRKRLRTFPKLITCSTIDWFMGWPVEALEQTAYQFLPKGLVKMAIDVHQKIIDINERYQQELRRYFYVTPSQYLQMLNTFQSIFQHKNDQATTLIDKFEIGVEKIIETEENVEKIRQVLFELQPKLEKATLDNFQLLKIIKSNQKEADSKKRICEQEELICQTQRQEANELRNLCQNQLDNVLPLLAKATEALDKISRDDMILLKSFSNPPASAAVVMQGLCYAFQEDGNVKSKTKDEPTTQDFWDYAKRYLLNDKLIRRIKKMKIDEIRAINPQTIAKLQNFSLNPLFDKEKVFNASTAAGNLAEWIRSVLATYVAVEIIEPKKIELKLAEENLQQAELLVKIKRDALEQALQVLKSLSEEYEKAKREKQKIEKQIEIIQAQLIRAEKLITGLGDEKESWKKKTKLYKNDQINVDGDCLLASAIISYLGVFPVQYRELCVSEWKKKFRSHLINYSENYSIQQHLSDPITINKWIQQKLPNDAFSIDNAIILKQSIKWSLMIDPQIQANQWIRNMEDSKTLLILNANQPSSQMQLSVEHALQIGYAILLENIGQSIDPLFEPILKFKSLSQQTKGVLRIGEKLMEVSQDFKFYMTTKLNNPHYQPQVCLMVTMLNFQVTLEGLCDQMLNIVVKIDEPLKEEQRIKNIQLYFVNKNRQLETENLILKLLSESVGDLLEDETLIDTLSKSKEEGQEIEETLKKLQYDAQIFERIREFYQNAAESVANQYFVVNDLSLLEPTYQWSLEFYIKLYQKAIREASYGKAKRIQNIIDKFTNLLYVTINRSLLEKDKIIFRFLLCVKIMGIPTIQFRACLTGPTITETSIAMPQQYCWMSKNIWLGIVDLKQKFASIFGTICDDLHNNTQMWEQFYQSQESYKLEIQNLSQFHINMLIKIIKPQLFIQATNYMIREKMGKQYLENIPTTFEAFYQESNNYSPLLCIVTPGADPRQDIINLAEKYNFYDKFNQLSLGQGQVFLALKLIKLAMQQGRWILLQNCHVALSFMPELESIYEQMNKKDVHKDFRLWLTSLPTNLLPHNVILKSIKMTYELPRGLKNNMLRSYYQQDNDEFENSNKSIQYKTLFFALTLFHACIIERRKFGPLGWNIPYNFSQHDLEISKEQLKYSLETQSEIQWDALHYLITETNYGGRVTDPQDRKLLNILLDDFLSPKIFEINIVNQTFIIPPVTSLKGYIEYIQQLPINDPPSSFGLHQNAEIYSSILETQSLSSTILQLLPRSVGLSTQHPDKIVKDKCRNILERLPEQFHLTEIQKKYQLISQNSLNTVLNQELVRYNKLLTLIQQSLNQLIRGLDGHIHISDESQNIYNSLYDNILPTLWNKLSYPTTKPLGAWIIDLIERLKFMQQWVIKGEPQCFWLGGFYFIQGFLTGQLQNYARKYKIAIDQFTFDFEFHKQFQLVNNGFYISNVYLDGARYDYETKTLQEPESNVLYYQAPYILFIPTTQPKEYKYFECPMYNTPIRQGELTTTGYSINFIRHIFIPIKQQPEFWTKRSVAMILQID